MNAIKKFKKKIDLSFLATSKSEMSRIEMSNALERKVKNFEDSKMKLDQKLDLPVKIDGSNYKIRDLEGDQVKIMTYIFS